MGSWIICPCGKRLHKNIFCGEKVYRLLRDDEVDALPDTADYPTFAMLFGESREVLHCATCGRLLIRWQRDGDYTVYAIEKNQEDPA